MSLSDRDRIVLVSDMMEPLFDHLPPNAGYGKDNSPTHLRWMVETVKSTEDMPSDKAARWLGCAFGLIDHLQARASNERRHIIRMIGQSSTACPAPLMDAYAEIAPLLQEKVELLRSNGGVEKCHIDMLACDLEWISGKRTLEYGPRLLWTSFLVGFIQGTLRHFDLLDFTEERDRTRPIFHRAYHEMGISPPATRERTT